MDVELRFRQLVPTACLLLAVLAPTARAQSWATVSDGRMDTGQDSLPVTEIRKLIAQHHPNALAGAPGTDAVWIVLDADSRYVWSIAESHATITDVLLRARKAQLTDALDRVSSPALVPGTLADSAARADLDRVVRDLKHYATLADISHVAVAALPNFLDVEGMTQSMVAGTFRAGQLGNVAMTVTIVRLKPAVTE